MGLQEFLCLFFTFPVLGPAKNCRQSGMKGQDLNPSLLPATPLRPRVLEEAARTVTALLRR